MITMQGRRISSTDTDSEYDPMAYEEIKFKKSGSRGYIVLVHTAGMLFLLIHNYC